MIDNKITPLFNLKEKVEIVFLDIEADAENRDLLQFGAIKLVKNQPTKANWYSNPGKRISSHALKLIGYDALKKIRMGQSPKEVIKKIYDFTKTAVFISFGDFDFNLLNELTLKYLNKKLNVVFVDFQAEWKKINNNQANISLSNLATLFEIKYSESELHDAFYDANLMYQIFRKWEYSGDQWVSKKIFDYNNNIKKTIDRSISEITIEEPQGYVLIDVEFKKHSAFSNPVAKNIQKISVITTKGDSIDENWSIDFKEYYEKNDQENFQHNLITCLRRFTTSAQKKAFYIYENQRNDLLLLKKLCADLLKKDVGNEYFVINGIDHYINLAQKQRTFNNVQNKKLVLTWGAILLARKELARPKI